MKICPQCGWENEDDFSFCLGCGTQLPSNVSPAVTPAASASSAPAPKICPNCGATVPPNNKFCGSCGTPIAAQSAPAPSAAPLSVNPSLAQLAPTAVPETAAPSPSFSTPSTTPKPASPARLVLLLPNGKKGGVYSLKPDKTQIGRKQGNILFLDDDYVSPLHATFIFRDPQHLVIRDENSLNGVFIRLRQRTKLHDGDVLLLGKQLLRFEELSISAGAVHKDFDPNNPPETPLWGSPFSSYWGRLVQLVGGGGEGNAVLLGGTQVDLGRERGQLTFPGDRFISAIHARISHEQGEFYLEDLGSRNGTFLRINQEHPLVDEDILIIGEQLLRVEFL